MISPLDLTTIANVTSYLAPTGPGQQERNEIQGLITGGSLYFLRRTGRGPADDSIPSQNPFVQPVVYNEWYDGNCNNRIFTRNSPIISVQALIIGTVTIPQSTAYGQWGWVIDGSGRSISLRGGGGSIPPSRPLTVSFSTIYGGRGLSFSGGTQAVNIQYTAGYALTNIANELQTIPSDPGPFLIVTSNPWLADTGVSYFSDGSPLTRVYVAPAAGQYYINNLNQYMFAAIDAGKQVLISYSTNGTPADITEKITKLVALNYKRRQSLDQRSVMMTGPAGGTTSYRDWETTPDIERVITYYQRVSRS